MKYNEIAYDDGCIMQEPEAEDDDTTFNSSASSSYDDSSEIEEEDLIICRNKSAHGHQIGSLYYSNSVYNSIIFHYSARNIVVQFSPECLIPYINKQNILMSPLNFQTNNSAPTATNVFNNVGRQNHLAYKMVRTESRIVHALCTAYGFSQAHPNSSDFNLMWHGGHVKPITLRTLQDFQRVNHFPRSYELTRKDRMYANVMKMQQTHGFKNFDFVAKSFILPLEYQEFMGFYQREARKGSTTWIIKPVASSRGRGIYLANNINHIPLDENIIVGRYIDNPFTIDGFKFDIRLYVTVTSYDPLIIYLHEEGLTRFCTIKYDKRNNTRNLRMHLTNYSLNKKSMDYVRCDNPDVEDYGNKWSMSAMLRYLRDFGIDTAELCSRIEDVVIKSIIAVELPVATATKMFVPNPRGNCSELYGFDILVDENLKPWLLEVNLSPSLATDAPLDLKIKSHVVADWLNLTGLNVLDPVSKNKAIREENQNNRKTFTNNNNNNNHIHQGADKSLGGGGSSRPMTSLPRHQSDRDRGADRDLSTDESKVLKWAREQNSRRGGFLRIFPRPDSWEKYGRFLQYRTTYNSLLARRLFRASNGPVGIDSKIGQSGIGGSAHSSSLSSHLTANVNIVSSSSIPIVSKFARNKAMAERLLQYERKLLNMTELVEVKKQRAIKDVEKCKKKSKKVANRNSNSKSRKVKVEDSQYGRAAGGKTSSGFGSKSHRSKSSRLNSRDPKDQQYYEKEKLLEKRSKLPTNSTKIMVVTKDIPMSAINLKSETVHNHVEKNINPVLEGQKSHNLNSTSDRDKQLASAYKSAFRSGRPSSGNKRAQMVKDKQQSQDDGVQGPINPIRTTRSRTRSRSNSKERPSTAANNSSNIKVNNHRSNDQMRIKSANPSGMSPASLNLISSHANSANIRIKTKKIYQQLKITPATHENFLSAIEARRAFHAYLTRVQIRLLKEATQDQNNLLISEQKQENQLALVTRFLVRAAENLPTPLPISVPNKDNFNLITRKKLIASQLNIFVQKYQNETNRQEEDLRTSSIVSPASSSLSTLVQVNNVNESGDGDKDTRQARGREDKDKDTNKDLGPEESASQQQSPSPNILSAAAQPNSSQHLEFNFFVKNASENELEDILTLYTKRNKSAAIFLGTKPAPKMKSIEISTGSRPTSTHNSYVDYIINEGKNGASNSKQDFENGSGDASKSLKSQGKQRLGSSSNSKYDLGTSNIRHRPPSAPAKTKPSTEERKVIDALARLNSNSSNYQSHDSQQKENQPTSKQQLQEIKKLAALQEEKAKEGFDSASASPSASEKGDRDRDRDVEGKDFDGHFNNNIILQEEDVINLVDDLKQTTTANASSNMNTNNVSATLNFGLKSSANDRSNNFKNFLINRKVDSSEGNYKKMNSIKLQERAKTSLESYADRKRAWY